MQNELVICEAAQNISQIYLYKYCIYHFVVVKRGFNDLYGSA